MNRYIFKLNWKLSYRSTNRLWVNIVCRPLHKSLYNIMTSWSIWSLFLRLRSSYWSSCLPTIWYVAKWTKTKIPYAQLISFNSVYLAAQDSSHRSEASYTIQKELSVRNILRFAKCYKIVCFISRDLRIVFFVRIESRIESAVYHASRNTAKRTAGHRYFVFVTNDSDVRTTELRTEYLFISIQS